MIAILCQVMGKFYLLKKQNHYFSCNNKCIIELGYYCITTLDGSTCRERCGDGVNLFNTHACDDGNNLSKDGCDSTCNLGKQK